MVPVVVVFPLPFVVVKALFRGVEVDAMVR